MYHAIIEGPDGSGKTRLIESLGLMRLHTVAFKPEYGDPIAWYTRRITEQTEGTGFDRLWLSELIYGPILRGQAAITEQQASLLKQSFTLPVIVCLPPLDVTIKWTRSRPFPAYQTDDFLIRSHRLFTMYADTDLVDFVYDWTTGTFRRSLGVPPLLRRMLA